MADDTIGKTIGFDKATGSSGLAAIGRRLKNLFGGQAAPAPSPTPAPKPSPKKAQDSAEGNDY